MCALCLTTSAYAVNIDQGSDLTVDAGSRDHIIAGNKLKMKNSLVGIMIGHDSEMENSQMGTSIGVYNTVKGYDSMAIGNHNIADGTNGDYGWRGFRRCGWLRRWRGGWLRRSGGGLHACGG